MIKKPIKHQNCTSGCQGSCCLKVKDLTIVRGEDTILEDVSFHMHCGELIALIGPNGAGKSTLFKSLLGQMEFSGSITYQDSNGNTMKPRIGYVPQSPAFDPGDPVSVADLFSTAISRYPVFLPTPKKLRKKILECLQRVNAEDLIDKRIGSLSGGEVQRVLLAMALEPIPNILILDEPMSGVDMAGERQLLALLDEIRNKYDLSILISTHDFATIQQVDKVILLKKQVLRQGPPMLVLSSPEFKRQFPGYDRRGGELR